MGVTLQVPLQDIRRLHAPLAGELEQASRRVLESGWYVGGSEVEAFEQEFAKWLGAEYAVSCANGTDALELALRAVGVERGDEVILAANAGMYGTVATLAVGGKPVYADVSPDTLALTAAEVVRLATPRTRAIIVTHLYGRATEVANLRALADGRGIALIEDAAEAHGAEYNGRKVGTWGHVSCFSFYPTKNLGALGDGGACCTQDDRLAERIRRLRSYGWDKRYHAVESGGRNSRLDTLQAALLRVKLPHLDRWNAERVAIARAYNEAFADLPLTLPKLDENGHVAHLYVVRTRERDELRAHLNRLGIATDVHFPTPDYLQPALAGHVPHPHLLETEAACGSVVTLPCFPGLTNAEREAVIAGVRSWRASV